jgi:cell division protein FtsI/penicillin-binding protein 2
VASRAAPARRRPARRAPSPAKVGARRVRILGACCILALVLVAGRAAWVQLVEAPHLSVLVTGQQRFDDPLPAVRGTMLDRKGEPLALSQPAITVGATPKFVRNPGEYAAILSPIVHVPIATLVARLSDRTHGFVYLARQLDPSVQTRVTKLLQLNHLSMSAISFVPESKRVYPQGIGLQLLGATDPDGNPLAGAELSLNAFLQGKAGDRVVLRGRDGQVIRVEHETPAQPGKTATLTVDQDIQASAEQVAAETLATWKAKAVTIVALDPRTGGVLAMASAPGVPSGGYSQATLDEQRLRAVTDGYEPGSTFKVVTIGAALQLGRVTPNTVLTVPYSMSLYGQTIRDADFHGTEQMTVSKILAESSNVGTVTIARTRLGGVDLSKWISKLGFGRKTGVDLPGEFAGEVLPYPKWSGTSILSFPIGEGVLVTPLQMASLYGAIADGGVWHEPHVLAAVDGHRVSTTRTRRLYDASTARELSTMLGQVVTDSVGTGTQAKVPGYTVAGKTGTAPKLNSKGVYDGATAGYMSSFVGYIPASRPRAVILVLVDSPHGYSYYGGDVAAPAFREVAATAMNALGVRPDDPASAQSAG